MEFLGRSMNLKWMALGLAMTACSASALAAGQEMPVYQPEEQYKLVFNVYGNGFKGLVREWGDAYMKHQPGVQVAVTSGGSDAAAGAIQHNTADVASFGRELTFTEYLGAFQNNGYLPTDYIVAGGGYDVPGSSFGLVVLVNEKNPVSRLTMKQLDGIFGEQRTGGYDKFKFIPHDRSEQDNIRAWGQVGLKGGWSEKEINTYGYAYTGMAEFFQLRVLGGSNKWNPNFRQYVDNGSRLFTEASTGMTAMFHDIAADEAAIGFAGMPQWLAESKNVKGVKAIALAHNENTPYVYPTRETMIDRTYPLTRNVYININKAPGIPLHPQIKDFMSFVLSKEGQDIVRRHGIYLPLPAEVVNEERRKL